VTSHAGSLGSARGQRRLVCVFGAYTTLIVKPPITISDLILAAVVAGTAISMPDMPVVSCTCASRCNAPPKSNL
jgi:hypothetical protein